MNKPEVTLPIDLNRVYKLDEIHKPLKLATTNGRYPAWQNTVQVYVVKTDYEGNTDVSAIEVKAFDYYSLKLELVKWDE